MEQWIPFERIAQSGPTGIALLLLIIIISIAILCKGADWLVEGAAQMAYRLGIPKIIVGATVVSLGTTSPEAAVSVLSAIEGNSGMALGNAIGSVICDTALIFGLCCLITRLPLDRFILNRHGWLQFGSGLLLVVLAFFTLLVFDQPIITRSMGIGLLILLVAYMLISIRWAKAHPTVGEDHPPHTTSVGYCLLLIVVGLALVLMSAKTLTSSAEQVCLYFHVPQAVVAATIIAFGTSLPELVTGLTSIKKGHPELLIGNIVGADILNILFVIGASATATPLLIPQIVFWLHLPVMILVLLLFRIYIVANKTSFNRLCGLPLLAIYVAFVIISYLYN
jgi:cation:H+ antiporter